MAKKQAKKQAKTQKKTRSRKKKSAKIQTDKSGDFVWESYFVGGKQKRQKIRVIGGEVVRDMDEYLLRNADDMYLHQIERWDLIEQRRMSEENGREGQCEPQSPARALRQVPIKIRDIEFAFESMSGSDLGCADTSSIAFLNLTTGEVVWEEEEAEEFWDDPNLLALTEDLEDGGGYAEMDEFVYSLEKGPLRDQLLKAIDGKGAFRRFKAIVYEGGNVELKHAWHWFETRQLRERIADWLRWNGIEPQWDCDIFEPPRPPNKRPELLRAVLEFVFDTRIIPGVRRIAMLGSLTSDKSIPRDVDLIVEMADDAELTRLAKATRRLSGKTMATGDNCGADVFLCNLEGAYLGRVCQWKKCEPFVRQSCEAQHCGRRKFLYDDLHNIKLETAELKEPPLELWPRVIARSELPEDVMKELVSPLGMNAGPAK